MSETRAQVEIRPLQDWQELLACVNLQLHTWGEGDVVPASLLLAAQKAGGIVAGAFDANGQLVGALLGFPTVRGGRIGHWSHMLAVRDSRRDQGLGRLLKSYQRDQLLRAGVSTVHWTYDPLEARNAHFNLNRLGAEVESHDCDLYGSGEGNLLHRGIGTDRFVVTWRLDSRRVREALAGKPPAWDNEAERAPIVNTTPQDAGAGGAPNRCEACDAVIVRIEIPADIQVVKEGSLDLARRWRRSTREAFEHYLERGYVVEAFHRDPMTRRCCYLLRKGETR
jgi:predicted GNAT superfamily acetyltransferase